MKPFVPSVLPILNVSFEKLIELVGNANKELAMYNGILQVMINPHILLAPLKTKEAVLSSRIEGTQISLTELMHYEASEDHGKINNNDALEVLNYKKAMFEAEEIFKIRPFIHLNMLKTLHSILLNDVRGFDKSRGEFRNIQVYIGSVGCSIENASYIPPEAQFVLPALTNWENYVNGNSQETLIQCAIMHAQFEIIHPFLDGNGRMGRMLIPLFLFQKNYISKPVFYLSEYFESNRQEYYSKLNGITANNNWDDWIKFFLNAIIKQSDKNITKAKEIIELYNNKKQEFIAVTHSEFAMNILDALFKKPVISGNELQQFAGIKSTRTANSIFKKLVGSNLITLSKSGRGNKSSIYSFDELIRISEK